MTKPNNDEYDIKEYDIYLILLQIIEEKEQAKQEIKKNIYIKKNYKQQYIMKNLFYKLPNNIKNIVYEFDDNEYNEGLYKDVLKELNKKQIIKF